MPRTQQPYFRVVPPIESKLRWKHRHSYFVRDESGATAVSQSQVSLQERPSSVDNSHQELLQVFRAQSSEPLPTLD